MLPRSRNFPFSIEKRRSDSSITLTQIQRNSRFKLSGTLRSPRSNKRSDPLARTLHGTLDQHWTTLADLSRNGAGVFVTVNKTTLVGRRTAENIIAARAYFLDCDGVEPADIKSFLRSFELAPHLIVESSSGKWHVYWFVDDASLNDFSLTQKKLSEMAGSDRGVKDLPRVMRLPGFTHQKDASNVSIVRIVFTHTCDNYSNDDFQ